MSSLLVKKSYLCSEAKVLKARNMSLTLLIVHLSFS